MDGDDKMILPTEMKVGNRAYDIVCFEGLEGDLFAQKDEILRRAKEMGAVLDKEDKSYILDHQSDIPIALRDKVGFVFINDHYPDRFMLVAYVLDRWCDCWFGFYGPEWRDRYRILRHKK